MVVTERKRVTVKGKRVTKVCVPVIPKVLEETVESSYSYIPECERTYVRGREWQVERH